MNMNDLTGQQFGRLTVVRRDGSNKWRISLWLCRCVCGNEKSIPGNDLKSDGTKSCGCLRKEGRVKHGHSGINIITKTYKAWSSMRQRCINKNDKDYNNYGGRGIDICTEWVEFSNFLKDMGECPELHSIDRINNNKGYYRENCRWATREQQARNRRNNHMLTFNRKTQCIVVWAEEYNIPPNILRTRLCIYGWSIKKALTTLVRKKVKSK